MDFAQNGSFRYFIATAFSAETREIFVGSAFFFAIFVEIFVSSEYTKETAAK